MRAQDVDVELVGADVGIRACPSAAKRSSQYGMVKVMPFDLVADVRCFFGRVHRQFEGVFQDAVDAVAGEHALLETNSRSVPSNMRPPTEEYSPSVFSRTT